MLFRAGTLVRKIFTLSSYNNVSEINIVLPEKKGVFFGKDKVLRLKVE